LLEEIAEAEDLSPGPQEVAQEMVSVAQRSGEPLAKVQAQFKKPEVMEQIVNELRHRKALQFVLQAAKGAEAEEQA
jgi:FKBP-type peptidyl-prolyl cis-trans isomerase (trigger factor)